MQQAGKVGGCPLKEGLVDEWASEYDDECEAMANLPESKESKVQWWVLRGAFVAKRIAEW